mmetsp:Transcript_2630/g.6666  ORF Transcript_2630/g.6666 Transcript_2630/m.6666 type:complete len:276 (-) Transcript_2630:181-1008(-)
MNKANFLASFWTGTTIPVKHVGLVESIEMSHGPFIQLLEHFRCCRLVDIIPINVLGGFRALIVDNEAILGRPTSVLASVDGERFAVFRIGNLTFVVGFFMFKQFRIRQVPVQSAGVGNAQRVQASTQTGVGSLKRLRHLIGVTCPFKLGGFQNRRLETGLEVVGLQQCLRRRCRSFGRRRVVRLKRKGRRRRRGGRHQRLDGGASAGSRSAAKHGSSRCGKKHCRSWFDFVFGCINRVWQKESNTLNIFCLLISEREKEMSLSKTILLVPSCQHS